jgi:hypothetical protein
MAVSLQSGAGIMKFVNSMLLSVSVPTNRSDVLFMIGARYCMLFHSRIGNINLAVPQRIVAGLDFSVLCGFGFMRVFEPF